MIFFQGQLIVYDKLDENTQQKVHLFLATVAHTVKKFKGEV